MTLIPLTERRAPRVIDTSSASDAEPGPCSAATRRAGGGGEAACPGAVVLLVGWPLARSLARSLASCPALDRRDRRTFVRRLTSRALCCAVLSAVRRSYSRVCKPCMCESECARLIATDARIFRLSSIGPSTPAE